jgi:hypothetical protein
MRPVVPPDLKMPVSHSDASDHSSHSDGMVMGLHYTVRKACAYAVDIARYCIVRDPGWVWAIEWRYGEGRGVCSNELDDTL